MIELPYIDRWLVTKLEADAALMAAVTGVWSDRIPAGEELPAVRFQEQGSVDVGTLNGTRVMVNALYLVVVTVEGADYGPAVPAANRLDEVLHRTAGDQGNVGQLWVLQCWREAPYRMPEADGEVEYRHLGGFFRILAQRDV